MTLLIPFAGLAPSPWKNGGGSTTEVALSPPGASFDSFDWRISLATIATAGPFSAFPGIDRTLALVDGLGVLLDMGADGRFSLTDDDPVIAFPGEAQVVASLIGAPTTDFNVMTRRSRCSHKLGRRVLDGKSEFAPRGDVTIVFLADGESLTVASDSERIGMVRYDAMIFDSASAWTLEADMATVFVVDIFVQRD